MTLRVRLAGVAALTLVAGGCFWPAPGAGPDRTGHNGFEETITPETVADLEEVWTATGDPGPVVEDPVTSNRAVHFIVRSEGSLYLYGIDHHDGSQMWRRPIGAEIEDLYGPLDVSPPVFSEDVLWIGYGSSDEDGSILDLVDPDSGGEKTATASFGQVDSVRGSRYATSRASALPGVGSGLTIAVQDVDDSGFLWIAAVDGGTDGTEMSSSPLTLGLDFVYHTGTGIVVDEGTPSRVFSIRAYAVESPQFCPSPVLALCQPAWSVELDGTRSPSPVLASQDDGLGDAVVFAATDAGMVYAIDAQTGDELWSTSVGAEVDHEPALADGHLFVPTAEGLVVLDADNGDTLWEADAGGAISHQPAVAGGLVYTTSGDTLSAFAAAGCGANTCDPLWSTSTGSNITGGPSVSRGQVYVGTDDGRLIAYGLM